MKIRIEISEDAPEEIVIRCKERTEEVKLIESVVENILRGGSELTLTIGSREYYVPKSDILFFETYDGKVCAHTKDRMYQTDYKLFQLEEILPAYFVRISKSVIANVQKISSLGRELTGNGEITFKGCDKATYFSRGYYKILKDKIEEVRFGK
ncbi:MAG: LytTR family transcriptional regulator DNA-binding domain-containing protein [Clostridia bacterium]|nr:LytTR family transcriptional regulator DNA-binding domain-containing protein [Clostridia bacterium]MBQ7847594.1 LytTR family transcriptional regulator DNA-binding domain-containing protein [Clostridia bacterium]